MARLAVEKTGVITQRKGRRRGWWAPSLYPERQGNVWLRWRYQEPGQSLVWPAQRRAAGREVL